MKVLLLAASAVALSSSLCSAAPCGVGTLASYIALGSAGCMIDGSTISGFQTVPGSATGAPIATGSVTVSPLGGASDPGLMFSTNLTSQANAPVELTFTYQIAGASYSESSIGLSNSSETVDGAVTEIENYCAGGAFAPDGFSSCTGKAGSLLTLDGIQQSDQNSFSSVSFIGVTNDFELDGGVAGTASGGVFTNQFAASSATPEPASLLFAGLGISCLAILKRRSISTYFGK